MRSLTPYERIKVMVAGREVDRPGASVWKHFHQDDRVVSDSVKAHVAFQKNTWRETLVVSQTVCRYNET